MGDLGGLVCCNLRRGANECNTHLPKNYYARSTPLASPSPTKNELKNPRSYLGNIGYSDKGEKHGKKKGCGNLLYSRDTN